MIDLFSAIENSDIHKIQDLKCGEVDVNTPHVSGILPISWAAEKGEITICKELVRLGCDVTKPDQDQGKRYPIHWAIQGKNMEVIQYLIKIGSDINCVDGLGFSPLDLAVGENELKIAEFLLSKGAELDRIERRGGGYPLHLACAWGYSSMVVLLVQSGSDFNLENDELNTPLHIAVKSGSLEIVEYLINNGAILRQDANGDDPMKLAAKEQQKDILDFLSNL